MSCLIVFDLEATCWAAGTRPERMEVIEFGAVRLDPAGDREFASFVRPSREPELSEFCTELTGIRQPDVDGAPLFPEAFAAFAAWVDEEPPPLACWGAWDDGQLRRQCREHGLGVPPWLAAPAINLKLRFAAHHDGQRMGMKRALRLLDLPLEGAHHRALDDARNLAKIARAMGWA